jgi:hypothetical protein
MAFGRCGDLVVWFERWRELDGSVIWCLGDWERCRDLVVGSDTACRRVINQEVIAIT